MKFPKTCVSALLLAAVLHLLSYKPSAALDVACLTDTGAVVSTPVSPTWSADRGVFNEKIDVQPVAVTFAYNQTQVQGLVQCAQAEGLKTVPRGGGHGYEGYSVQAGALVVDVSNLTSFSLDAGGTVATFGTGFRLGQLFLKMWETTEAFIPAGLCPWVGTAGHLLGGGTGLNSRSYGLACDQIVGLTMVNSQGVGLEANATQNADLLWASCGGGGGNLGIVTSFSVKVNSVPPQVTTIQLNWAGYDQAAAVFDLVQKWVPFADRRLSLQILIGYNNVAINAQWQGSQADALAELQQSGILGITTGLYQNIVEERSWINATLLWAAGTMGISQAGVNDLNMTNGVSQSARSSFQAASSYNQQLMSPEGIQQMVDAVSSLGPNGTGWVEHKMLQGAVADVSPNATAFFWRSALFESQWYYYWESGYQEDAASSWLSSTVSAMKPYVGQGNYINYPDPLLAATSAWQYDYYGDNLAEYIAVKTRYDPTDYFSNPLTVQPNTSTPSSGGVAAVAIGDDQPPEASANQATLPVLQHVAAAASPPVQEATISALSPLAAVGGDSAPSVAAIGR